MVHCTRACLDANRCRRHYASRNRAAPAMARRESATIRFYDSIRITAVRPERPRPAGTNGHEQEPARRFVNVRAATVVLISLCFLVLQGGFNLAPVPVNYPGLPQAYASLSQAKKAPFREQVGSVARIVKKRPPSGNDNDFPPAAFLPAGSGIPYLAAQVLALPSVFTFAFSNAVRPLRDRPESPRAPPDSFWF